MISENVTIKTADGEFGAYVARPYFATAHAVVVIQEIFGVNQVMRDICDSYAYQGLIAICPDLFWRIEPGVQLTDKTKEEWGKAMSLMNAFDVDKGVEDIQATIDHMLDNDTQCAGRVGAVGFCLGGQLAYLAAARTTSDATVGFYGVNIDKHLDEAANIKKPLMLHVAGKDSYVPPEAQDKIKQGLAGNPLATVHDYPEREHAFARIGGEHFHAGDAALAQQRTITFFKYNLS